MIVLLVIQPVFDNQETKPSLANSELLKNHVYQLSETIPQESDTGNRLELSAQYIYLQLLKYSKNISFQDYDVQGVMYRNIVVDIKGQNQCGLYVVGAHFDTYHDLPGADDNISGVAGLIELLHLFSNVQPLCDIQLVAYTLEEPPYFRSDFMGSYIHAKSLKDKNVNVKAMLSLEMIGYFDDEIGSQEYPL